MKQQLSLTLPPEIALDEPELARHLHEKYASSSTESFNYRVLKTSIDARKKQIKVNLDIEVAIDE
ncbi:MAG: FAD-binding protein, partial [Spirosomaceae bacterium]|nr:FAD-binding protein [Spirosomataceae bacterium]